GCFPTDPGLIAAMVAPIRDALADAAGAGKPRLLLSAHGLPKKIVAAGDPYQWQVEETAAAIIQGIGMSGLDWVTSYQSRVGPLEWIGPSTEAEIQRAGADGVPVVVAPIAFVSEHIETLVEIEIEYRHLAGACGVPKFVRVPTVGAAEAFIDGLARQVEALLIDGDVVRCGAGRRLCPTRFNRCVCA
ncbi:MAG: ferrochelatase, partial [Alphaproteobacteria bacterium]|nr:ferrochelatase [Alphaproteobacteria bacterium]